MDNLTLRHKSFIKLMLKENEYKPIKYFSNMLKVSDKTLKNDLPVIEKYLEKYPITLDRKTGYGIIIKLEANTKRELLNDINSLREIQDQLSITSRRSQIIKLLLVESNTNTSIQKLSDKYYVSKASIVNDFKYIEEWLQKFDIELEKTIEGTKVSGNETSIRKAIASLLEELLNENTQELDFSAITRLDTTTFNGLQKMFNVDWVLYIESILTELEYNFKCSISEPYYINLLTHILICLKRIEEGNQIEDSNCNLKLLDGVDEFVYENTLKLVDNIYKKYKVKISESEICYIYQFLVSTGLGKSINENTRLINNDPNNISKKLTENMITQISDFIDYDLTQDTVLAEALFLHIRPMLNRLKYNIQIKNPLLEEIQERFSEILGKCELSIFLLVKKYNLYSISIDEIGYIATYFQAAIERSISKKRVMVICHSGYGTSQLLTTRLRRAFPQWVIVDVLSTHALSKTNIEDIDFIVSTVHLDIKEKPYLIISALLRESDIANITNMLLNESFENFNKKISIQHLKSDISERNIYINKSEESIKNKINQNRKVRILFKEIVLNKDFKIFINNKNNRKEIFMAISDEGDISFYLIGDDNEYLKVILIEIQQLYHSKNNIKYLSECITAKDVKRFFTN
ncbi:BglG family transcription antiterminator [Clostridium estertheticum]|uniref:BglG family transcription antiterminator n=1 Tax=Clostridium estertheticum TaxID=238834 RepID=UPI001C7DC20F|nr:PRD domain-containing protein [Clostridium estertheticum]MBX4265087.1 PRD domain-containing protein [Clostridium estertheticum]WLC88549.1 PRD domain-containing protein [Clostridium estertheticum]